MLSSPYGAQIPNTPGIRSKSRRLFQTLLHGFIPLEVQPENRFADFTLTKSIAVAMPQKRRDATEHLSLFLISIHLQHLLWRPDTQKDVQHNIRVNQQFPICAAFPPAFPPMTYL